MINIDVPEFKIKMCNREFTFRLDFNALLKMQRKYKKSYTEPKDKEENKKDEKESQEQQKDSIDIFNEFINGINPYENIIKILSCACVEKEWEEDELARELPFNFDNMKLIDNITMYLVNGVLNTKESNESKNEETNQNQDQ